MLARGCLSTIVLTPPAISKRSSSSAEAPLCHSAAPPVCTTKRTLDAADASIISCILSVAKEFSLSRSEPQRYTKTVQLSSAQADPHRVTHSMIAMRIAMVLFIQKNLLIIQL